MASHESKWERVRRSIGYATVSLEAVERLDANGLRSELRERDVERSLEQALDALRGEGHHAAS